MMNTYKLEMVNEDGKIATVIYTQANGKEEAIEKEMDKLFTRNWRMHAGIEKVIATQC